MSFTRCAFNNYPDIDAVTWFVQGFAIQFKIRKQDDFNSITIDGLEATVCDYQPVPQYQLMYGVYPCQSSLYLIEIDPGELQSHELSKRSPRSGFQAM